MSLTPKECQDYLVQHNLTQLLQSVMIGLVHDQPDDPVNYIAECMKITRKLGGTNFVFWNSFIGSVSETLQTFETETPDEMLQKFESHPRKEPVPEAFGDSQIASQNISEIELQKKRSDNSGREPSAVASVAGSQASAIFKSLSPTMYDSIQESIHKAASRDGSATPSERTLSSAVMFDVKEQAERVSAEASRKSSAKIEIQLDNLRESVNIPPAPRSSMRKSYSSEQDENNTPDSGEKSGINFPENVLKKLNETNLDPSFVDDRISIGISDLTEQTDKDSLKEKNPEEVSAESNWEINLSDTMDGRKIIFVVGGPGSGKGTQCDLIVEKFGFTHLSSGEILREEVDSGSETGQEIQEIMERGELVPLAIVLKLIKENMDEHSESKGFLIDGYPREVDQGIQFEEKIGPCSLVLWLDVSQDTMVKRLLKRAETSGRVDDNEETIKKRLKTFVDATEPVIEHYKAQNKVARIDSERSVEDIFADINKVLSRLSPSQSRS